MKHKILIVVDMQFDFVDGTLGSEEAKVAAVKIEEKIKSLDDSTFIIFTRDTHYDNYMETLEGKKLPIPHCIFETEGWNVIDTLIKAAKGKEIHFLNKKTFGATGLHNCIFNYCIQKQINIEDLEVEFCGVCTDICVVSNALLLRANFPNMDISLHKDLCAGTDPDHHEAALKVMEACQIDII